MFIFFDMRFAFDFVHWQNACKAGWFSEKESEELCNLANEVTIP